MGRTYLSPNVQLDDDYICMLGSSYDTRKRPQIRFRKGRPGIYVIILGPYPHRARAFRAARVYRRNNVLKLKAHSSIFVIKGEWGRSRTNRRGRYWVALRGGWGKTSKQRPIEQRPKAKMGGARIRRTVEA